MRGMARRFAAGLLLCVLFQAAFAQVADTTGNPAIDPVPQLSEWWTARHLQLVERAKQGDVDLLFVGDSITQNYEKPGPAPDEVFLPTWEEFFAPHKALNLGYSGDQTQNVLWRLQHGEVEGLSPKNIVLLIGTNNTARSEQTSVQVSAGVIAVVAELHKRLPRSKILLIAILPSGVSAAKSTEDDEVNATVREQYADSSYVRCLDLSSLFLKQGALDIVLFYDPRLKTPRPPLHPDSRGQRLMAEAISRALFSLPRTIQSNLSPDAVNTLFLANAPHGRRNYNHLKPQTLMHRSRCFNV
jgi:lysophospholipase L1-like esterase